MTVGWVLGALLTAAYAAVAIIVWRRTAWWFADKARYDPREPFTSFEIVWGLATGAVFAAVWPLTVAIWLVAAHGIAYLGRRFLLPPPHLRQELLAEEAAERERRIAELERQIETHR
jgi:hypothetical protein